MVLTRTQARTFYDRFGKKQDTQAFYENAALDELVAHSAFEHAEKVFELGCGTGRFAARLFDRHFPPSATYLGIDLSRTMTSLAEQRLSAVGKRARVVQSDGAVRFPLADRSVDRVVSTYVLDLLSENDARQAIAEARRVLVPGGKLCLASLTYGSTFPSRIVSTLWQQVFRLHAPLVGGCRPVRLAPLLDPRVWSVEYHDITIQFGVPSEVLVASPRNMLDGEAGTRGPTSIAPQHEL